MTTSPLDRWQCPNLDLGPVEELCRRLPRDRLVVTGAHGTLFPEEILALTGARAIIRGQPEATALEMVQGRPWAEINGLSFPQDGEVRPNPPRPALDLDLLPPPAFHLVDLADYGYELLGRRLGLVETARGCPFKCAFCLKAMYPLGGRAKSVGQVLDEVERLVRVHDARSLYFMDLDIAGRRRFLEEICQGLIRRRISISWTGQARLDAVDKDLLALMWRAGCRLIHFGVETANPESLRAAGKGLYPGRAAWVFEVCRRLGLPTLAFFMVGLPGEGLPEAEATLALARRLAPDFASFHICAFYPGTAWGGRGVTSWSAWAVQARKREKLWSAWLRRAAARYHLRPIHLARLARSLPLPLWREMAGLSWSLVK